MCLHDVPARISKFIKLTLLVNSINSISYNNRGTNPEFSWLYTLADDFVFFHAVVCMSFALIKHKYITSSYFNLDCSRHFPTQ